MKSRLEDVARLAKVSVSTASRALSGRGRVSDQTRSAVLEAARRVGYDPRPPARGQGSAGGGTGYIGILFNKRLHSLVSDAFYGHVMEGVEQECRRRGYQVFFSTISGPGDGQALVRQLSDDKKMDGLILAGNDIPVSVVSFCLERKIPVVLVDNSPGDLPVDCVSIDNITGGHAATAFLLKHGHRSIAYLCGPFSHPSLRERFVGYRNALDEAGIPFDPRLVWSTEEVSLFNDEGGFQGMLRLLAGRPRPTAVFAANDFMAIGALRAAIKEGLRVPEDLSIVGFDDVDTSRLVSPPLTTVRVMKRELGAAAADRLFERIGAVTTGESLFPLRLVVYVHLVERESVCAPAGSSKGDDGAVPSERVTRVGRTGS
ncbi:MAG: LacI family DNA-binding transcriptional regulator [Firmicutes bacterium]|nr:LacI family DNA-binding transcriptional regulator [Bacillota bacterium]